MSSPFSRYILDRSHEEEITSPQGHLVEPELVTQANLTKTPTQILVIDEKGRPPQVNPGRISITRSEKLTLSRVLDQLPPGLLQGEGVEWDQPISVMVTNVPEGDQTNLTRTYNPNIAASSRMPAVTYPPTAESSRKSPRGNFDTSEGSGFDLILSELVGTTTSVHQCPRSRRQNRQLSSLNTTWVSTTKNCKYLWTRRI